ncbi:Peroxidase [Trema orientale]|uniref:Peroxidase n=1 Tax=Trema orientale TaxID=63057 RepID=A0A2P5F6B3_TREOI|nr:Peroxidase [Trema orientale]
MAFPPLLLLLLLLVLSVSPFSVVESKLSLEYYRKTCPDFEKIVREIVTQKQMSNPTTAAGTLRLFFHDCMVEGCDASVFISSNHVNSAERDADLNLSLPGDAFDVVVRAKTALELACPGIVSCADILAQTTRDLIIMVGGPFYEVRLGRKDGLVSKASLVEGNVPRVNHTMDEIIKIFEKKGFTLEEMVALSGGHTIGFSHCKEFADRIFHYSKTNPTDPEIHPKFATALKKTCANYTTDRSMSAFNDVMTPGKFDNMYYQNLKRGLGLLKSDHALFKDPRTKPIIELYANDQKRFFDAFSHAMEKLSVHDVKTGRKGEVRRRCDAFNSIET